MTRDRFESTSRDRIRPESASNRESGFDRGDAGVRLQKVLAGAGVGSRRACEALISAGRVSVDGATVQHQGMRVDPKNAVIHVDGLRIQLDDSSLTLALHKPAGVYSTMADEQGRPDLSGYVAAHSQRLFHVGRLDAETTGLILLTNDGELAHRLTHPSYVVPKTYIAQVEGRVTGALRRRLLQGVELQDGPVVVDALTIKESSAAGSLVELDLHEGRNHIVRRLLAEVGHPVLRLSRTRIGPIRLGTLKPGRTREISGKELGTLMSAVGL